MQDLEKKLLSLLMYDKENYFNNYNSIHPDLFQTPIYKHIYKAILSVINDFNVLDIVSVSSKLKGFENVSNELIEIESCDVFSLDIRNIIKELEELRRLRDLKNLGYILTQDNLTESKETIDKIEKTLLSFNRAAKDVVEFGSLIDELSHHIKNKGDGLTGIPTGFTDYDKHTRGLQPQDLIIIAAETSQGKTSFALSMVNNAMIYNTPALFISLEMSKHQLISRLLSNNVDISSKEVLYDKLDSHKMSLVDEGLEKMRKFPLYIDDSGSSNFNDVINNIRRYVIQRQVKIVVVDYLQLMNNKSKGSNKEQEVGDMARGLKNIAKELDITVIALSQLSRDRQNPKPTLSRLRQSGQIEEAADQVILLFRPEYYEIHQIDLDGTALDTGGVGIVYLAKGRNVGVNRFVMKFTPHLTKWENQFETNQF